MTPNHLNMFKINNTNMHDTYTAKAQIYIRFALQWAIFELRPNLWKSAQNDPKWSWHAQGQKYQHACYTHTWGPNFRPFRSTMSHFWVTAQFSEKCTVFQVKNTNMHVTYTHKGQIFNLFRPTISHFSDAA